MIHQCKVHYSSFDAEQAERLGLTDKGQWVNFAIHLDIVVAVQEVPDDPTEEGYECTRLYTDQGDTYLIDTPYEVFIRDFVQYHLGNEEQTEEDMTL